MNANATVTAETLTATMIDALEQEAAIAGDRKTVAACRAAASGSLVSRRVVAAIIRSAAS